MGRVYRPEDRVKGEGRETIVEIASETAARSIDVESAHDALAALLVQVYRRSTYTAQHSPTQGVPA